MPRGTDRYDEARRQGRLWSPRLLRGDLTLAAWHDAADFSTLTTSSGRVSQWSDKSGNNRHQKQSTSGSQPLLELDGFNALPTLYFDGARSLATWNGSAGDAGLGSAAIYSAFAAGTMDSGAASNARLITLEDTGSGQDFQAGFGYIPFMRQGSANTVQSYGGPVNGSNLSSVAVTLSAALNLASIYDGTTQTTYLHGTPGTPTAVTVTAFTGDLINIGSRQGNLDRWTGRVSEFLLIKGSVPSNVRQRIGGYIAWRWKMVESLVASHPFKNRPPLIGD